MREFKPYNIVLEERPDWWKVRLPEIAEELSKVKKGRVETILPEKDIRAVFYQEKDFPAPEVRWTAAASSADPNRYKTSGYDPQCIMMIAGVHGAEAEGVITILNLVSLLETGKDLRGKERPVLCELLKKYRLVMIPCCNPDGRKISPDHMRGCPMEEFHRISQGVWADGTTISWAESKQYFPLPLDRVAFPGGYPNGDGFNIMHDCAPGRLSTKEASAILDLTERCQPDLFLNLHSQEFKSLLCRPGLFNYPGHISRGNELAAAVYKALCDAGYPALEPKGSSYALNLNTAAVMLTGAQAMTYESTTDSGLSFDGLLESHYVMLETVLSAGLQEPFAPRDKK